MNPDSSPRLTGANDFWVFPAVCQLLVWLFLLCVADGGRLARCWLTSSAMFAAASGLLVALTRGRPNRAARLFVMLGWLVLVPAGMYVLLGRWPVERARAPGL
ncbi:MAG: hypothetical protein K2X87_33505 [Gemmataceae bacterium]|nr:hypothetical protein [Gemmataceae bacterium]